MCVCGTADTVIHKYVRTCQKMQHKKNNMKYGDIE